MRLIKRLMAGFATMALILGSAVVITGQQTVSAATVSSSTEYNYRQFSAQQASPYYVVASFASAAGLALYSASFLRERRVQRSRYVSRTFDYAKTTY